MIDAISIANSGLLAQQKWLDTISSNISNMQTMGYKKENAQFANLVASNNSNNRISEQGIGVSLEQTYTDFKNGDVQTTNQPYDFAIQGQGFFEIEQADGSLAYTRIGQFHVNSDGQFLRVQRISNEQNQAKLFGMQPITMAFFMKASLKYQ